MDMEWIKLGFQVLQFLLWCGTSFYVYLSNKDKVTNDRIGRMEDELDDKLDGHIERIAKLEAHAEQTPTHDDLGEIYKKISRVDTSVSALSGEFAGVRNLLNTIHHHLLSGGKQ